MSDEHQEQSAQRPEFVETAPGVWMESEASRNEGRLDAEMDAALARAGLPSLADLRRGSPMRTKLVNNALGAMTNTGWHEPVESAADDADIAQARSRALIAGATPEALLEAVRVALGVKLMDYSNRRDRQGERALPIGDVIDILGETVRDLDTVAEKLERRAARK